MSAETILDEIATLQEYKLTTDVKVEDDAVNKMIKTLQRLEDFKGEFENDEGGIGESDAPRYNKKRPL